MKRLILLCMDLVFLLLHSLQAQSTDIPGQHWMQYATPEDAGFSSTKLDSAKRMFEQSEAAAVFVVHKGRVLVAWGETTRRFRCASVRKSYMSALYGIYVDRGKIDLTKTIAELNIDDNPPLTAEEKQATVLNLLTARSGVYHPAAYSPRGMEENLPERGSHAPGTFWYYNNWDFNTLLTIFEQETGQPFFEAFKQHIAEPLQMEDFTLWNTYYCYEPEKSQHPAYLFRMTARDMARFGLLYLNEGRWGDRQIIPAAWIEQSTQRVVTDLGNFGMRGAYGYLWWISDGVNGEPMYFASGSGGQRICVLPESEMVFVHLVNSYDNYHVSQQAIMALLEMILEARVGPPAGSPILIPYDAPVAETPDVVEVAPDILEKYAGSYHHPILGEFKISSTDKNLIMETRIGKFKLLPLSPNEFYPEDIQIPVFFELADSDTEQGQVESIYNPEKKLDRVVFYY